MFNRRGLPLTKQILLTLKLDCNEVYLYNILSTIFGIASRFKMYTIRIPFLSDSSRILEIPSMGWQDTVFSKTSKTPTQEKTPESYEEIIEYYDSLFNEADKIGKKNNISYFLGLVLHPYDNSFYNKDNKFFYDIYNISKRLKADFCKYEDAALYFNIK